MRQGFPLSSGAIWPNGPQITSTVTVGAGPPTAYGEEAEYHQQEEDEHDADEDARAGGRRARQRRHAEQARRRRDDEKDENPFDHRNRAPDFSQPAQRAAPSRCSAGA
jgi:hypothetical protein